MDGADCQRGRRQLQQHRSTEPGDDAQEPRSGGHRGVSVARDSHAGSGTDCRSVARPPESQACDDGERHGAGRDRAGVYSVRPSKGRGSDVCAERDADVRVAVFYQRPRGDSAGNRDTGRAAYGEHDDADYVVGESDDRRVPGRDGSAIGISSGPSDSMRCRS